MEIPWGEGGSPSFSLSSFLSHNFFSFSFSNSFSFLSICPRLRIMSRCIKGTNRCCNSLCVRKSLCVYEMYCTALSLPHFTTLNFTLLHSIAICYNHFYPTLQHSRLYIRCTSSTPLIQAKDVTRGRRIGRIGRIREHHGMGSGDQGDLTAERIEVTQPFIESF